MEPLIVQNAIANPYLLLEQVETLLKTQDQQPTTTEALQPGFASQSTLGGSGLQATVPTELGSQTLAGGIVDGVNAEPWRYNKGSPQPMNDLAFPADMDIGMGLDDNTFTWEMIGLGLEEPLPPQDTIDELYVESPARLLSKPLIHPLGTEYTSTLYTCLCR
jgi:hypothetical protein